ncbi:MAG: hypothetical protein CM15mV34_0570 [Caudoviricetes sp.]|nr:MAG: hypothetical protein CM15mV34_0570 [Caudoviricetes sp.]
MGYNRVSTVHRIQTSQFYDWPPDMGTDPYSEGKWQGKYRKLSTTLLLNDPSEFDGGQLEFHHQEINSQYVRN